MPPTLEERNEVNNLPLVVTVTTSVPQLASFVDDHAWTVFAPFASGIFDLSHFSGKTLCSYFVGKWLVLVGDD